MSSEHRDSKEQTNKRYESNPNISNMRLLFDNALVSRIEWCAYIKVYYEEYKYGIYYKPRPTHGFVYFLSGKCEYVFKSGVSFIAEKDMFLYLPKEEIHEIHPISDFDCLLIDFDTANKIDVPPFAIKPYASAKLRGKFEKSIHLYCRRKHNYVADIKSELFKIFAYLQSEQERDYVSNSVFKKIEPAVTYISTHFIDPDLSISYLAELCSMCESYLGRLFRAYYGMYPKQYILKLKLDHAKTLLSTSNAPIVSISNACGFQEQYYFSRFFKRSTGLTPSEYRAQYMKMPK